MCFWIAYQGLKIGNCTGNINWWIIFTVGWILIGIGRIISAVLYDILSIPNSRYISLSLIIIALSMMVYGMHRFTEIVVQKVKNHE